MARRYLGSGIDVVAFDVDSAGLEKMAGDDTAFVGEIRTVGGDVRDRSSLESAVEVAESSFGGLDIVAAIAGITRVGPVYEMSDADRDLVLGVNLIGVWNSTGGGAGAAAPRTGGRMVCGSVESVLGGSGLSAYVASKHGLIGLVKSVALEVREHGDHRQHDLSRRRRHGPAARDRPSRTDRPHRPDDADPRLSTPDRLRRSSSSSPGPRRPT